MQSESLYVGTYGRIRTVVQAPDGAMWFTTSNRDNRVDPPRAIDDRVIRLGPPRDSTSDG